MGWFKALSKELHELLDLHEEHKEHEKHGSYRVHDVLDSRYLTVST